MVIVVTFNLPGRPSSLAMHMPYRSSVLYLLRNFSTSHKLEVYTYPMRVCNVQMHIDINLARARCNDVGMGRCQMPE